MKAFSINPSTGELIKDFDPSSFEDVNNAVFKAKKTFINVWSLTSLEQRVVLFKSLANLISQHSSELLDLIELEVGKPRGLGGFEIEDIVSGIKYFSSEILKIKVNKFDIDTDSYPLTTVDLPLFPHGVVGVISPWNFPFWTPMINIVPAILTGNTVVFKPDEHATLMGLKIKELFELAGFPTGVLNVVIGGANTGKWLVESDIDKITLTGSVETGKDVLRNIGIKPVLLELGGNDAAIVCEDADLKQAIPAICWGAIYNAGQACNGIKRIYLCSSLAKEFIDGSIEYIKKLKRKIDYGPIISEEARGIIITRITKAVQDGAELLYGKIDIEKPGFWLDPIIINYTNDEIELTRDETFGPVMPIRIVENVQEAVYLANNTRFGLGANVWTNDVASGQSIALKLQAKMVCVNEALFGLPGGEYWGGWNNSGLGTTENRLYAYLKRKILITNANPGPRSWWFPMS